MPLAQPFAHADVGRVQAVAPLQSAHAVEQAQFIGKAQLFGTQNAGQQMQRRGQRSRLKLHAVGHMPLQRAAHKSRVFRHADLLHQRAHAVISAD